MRRSTSLRLFILAAVLALATGMLGPAFPARAASSGSDLVAAVNALRRSKGLADLVLDSRLTAAAQGHSNYQASIGSWTHSGPGGSTPTSRAIAAGFGGGASVFISENVAYMSTTATLSDIIYGVWSDAVHWNTMTNSRYTHAGGGVTVSGNYVYYTLDVGYIAGGSSSSGTGSSQVTTPRVQVTVPTSAPLLTSTPNPDGSVYHTVQYEQFLLPIAQAYGLKLDELKRLNNLVDDTIFAGQKLLIQRPLTPTASATITRTLPPPTRTPTATTPPPTATISPTPTASLTPTPAPFLPSLENIDRQTFGAAIIAACAVGLLLVVISLFRKK